MYQEFRPAQRLRPLIECGWVLSGSVGLPTRVLPDGCVDVFVTGRGDVLVAGPATGCYELSTEGALAGVRLRPGAAGAVLGQPADEFRDTRVAFDSTFAAPRAVENLLGTTSPNRRMALLQGMLIAYLTGVDPVVDRQVERAVQLLRSRPDRPVSTLAAEVGLSDRQLRRRFHAAVGYGPRRLGRVFRFQRLLDLLHGADGRAGWAELAVLAGYADQSHMINECSALAGVPPTALRPGKASVSSNTADGRSP